MKKFTMAMIFALAIAGAVFTQNQRLDLKAYFAMVTEQQLPDWDFSKRHIVGDDPADTARFSNLTGDLSKIDSYLEFALLMYYSAAERSSAERGNAILPLNNPRLAGKHLGAAVYKELQEVRFLDANNPDRIGRYEDMLKFIRDKNKVTQNEINSTLRAGIAAEVDAQAGQRKISASVLSNIKKVIIDFYLNPSQTTFKAITVAHGRYAEDGSIILIGALSELNSDIADAVLYAK